MFYKNGRRIIIQYLVPLIFFLPAIAAAETESTGIQQTQQLPSVAGLFFRVLISLLLIFVLTYVVLKVIKKQQDVQQKMQWTQKDWIKVFDSYSLGPGRVIYLMEILSRVYLVAVSDNNINILTEVDQSDEAWLNTREDLEKNEERIPTGLTEIFKNRMNRIVKPTNNDETSFKEELGIILDEQVNDQRKRTNALFERIKRGGNDSE